MNEQQPMSVANFFAEAKRLNLRMPLTHEQMCAAFDAKDAELDTLRAQLSRLQAGGQVMAWLSIDSIGERYLTFSEPQDDDEHVALVAATPAPSPAPVAPATSGFLAVVPGSFVPNPEMSTEVPGLTKAEVAQYVGQRHAFESAPVAQEAADTGADERGAFERVIAKDGGDLSKFGTGQHIHYVNSAVNNAWTGWQARAALAARSGQVAASAMVPMTQVQRSAAIANAAKEVECARCGLMVISSCKAQDGKCPGPDIYSIGLTVGGKASGGADK